MQRVIRTRGLMVRGIIWIGVTALVAINAATLAQTVTQSPQDPSQKQVLLIRKDTAECSGSDVPNVDSPLVGDHCKEQQACNQLRSGGGPQETETDEKRDGGR